MAKVTTKKTNIENPEIREAVAPAPKTEKKVTVKFVRDIICSFGTHNRDDVAEVSEVEALYYERKGVAKKC